MASPISATIEESRCWTTERVMGSIVADMETLRRKSRTVIAEKACELTQNSNRDNKPLESGRPVKIGRCINQGDRLSAAGDENPEPGRAPLPEGTASLPAGAKLRAEGLPIRMGLAPHERLSSSGSLAFFKAIEQDLLGGIDLEAGGCEFKPCGAIDFGKSPATSTARGPFDLERIALDVLCVQVGFNGKRRDDLAAALSNLSQRKQVTGQLDPEFFAKFLASNLFGIFAGNIFALWDGPGASVLVAPERPAGVNEKHFHRSLPSAKCDDTGACRGHDRCFGGLLESQDH